MLQKQQNDERHEQVQQIQEEFNCIKHFAIIKSRKKVIISHLRNEKDELQVSRKGSTPK